MDLRYQQLLARINQRIPAGVDWKSGALKYLDQLFEGDDSEAMRRFHLVKPFSTLEDTSTPVRMQAQELCRELAFFAHILSTLNLPSTASFLDVACGTGWVSHYFAKLGFRVCGFDISPSMIELARERMRLDPWPTTTGLPLDVDLFVHDIECGPLERSEQFDVAILESALHHFVDPIKALRNIRQSLKPDGLVFIIEGSSDGKDVYCREIMEKFDTLERPYTPDDLEEIIACAGFPLHRRMVPLSGFFHPGRLSAASVNHFLCTDRSWNTIVCFNSSNSLGSVCLQGAEEPACFLTSASGETVVSLGDEHWIGATSRLVFSDPGRESIGVVFRSPLPNLRNMPMRLVINDLKTGEPGESYDLFPCPRGDAELRLQLPLHDGRADYELCASEVFSPNWFAQTNDVRLLSGRICVVLADEITTLPTQSAASQFASDLWMGPMETFQPTITGSASIRLRFTSPLPRQRLRSQQIWVRMRDGACVSCLTLRPGLSRESSAVLDLPGLTQGEQLEIASSDCFSPAWTGGEDTRLLSYRLTQEA